MSIYFGSSIKRGVKLEFVFPVRFEKRGVEVFLNNVSEK